MAELLSIKERIERVYVRLVQDILDEGCRAFRWDGRGLRDPDTGSAFDANGDRISMKPGDALIIPLDEQAQEGGMGDVGTTIKILTVEVHVLHRQDDTDPLVGSQLHNRWLLKLETAITANYQMTEPSGMGNEETLATDTRVTATGEPPREEGQREFETAILFETQYEHYRTDPTQAAGVTAFTED